ncbi:MAG: amidase [Alphaproteobacteria bacterium]
MTDLDLCYTPATELARRIALKEISPVAVVQNSLARIEEINPALNGFCFTYPEEALAQAKAAEKAVLSGEALGPLHGVPIAIKDLTPTKGKRTTCGSYIKENWVPDQDAIVVENLLNAGAIMVGKTTTPEFAFSSFTESALWGITRNPWNPERTAGGSSGGSAVAVTTGCVPLAEGSDMGGSVRIPAAMCGIVALKPSFGRIPFEFLPSQFDFLSNHGPLTRTVADAALFLKICQGPDERDPATLASPIEVAVPPPDDIKGVRLAMSVDFSHYRIDPDVEANLRAAADALRDAGAEVEEVELGWTADFYHAWYDHWRVFHATYIGHYLDQWRAKMHPELVTLIEEGLALSAVDYKKSEIVYSEAWAKLRPVLKRADALICPTEALPAPPVTAKESEFDGFDDQGRLLGLDLTMQFNALKLPAISVPTGFSKDGLPTGMQIAGRRYDDLTVLRVAAAFEKARPWADKRPPI